MEGGALFILPKHHVLATRQEITLNEIAHEPFVLMKEGFALRVTMDHIFEQVNITPNIVFEGEEAATIAGFVAAGLGVSILPDFKGLDQTNIAKVRISWPRFERIVGVSGLKGSIYHLSLKTSSNISSISFLK